MSEPDHQIESPPICPSCRLYRRRIRDTDASSPRRNQPMDTSFALHQVLTRSSTTRWPKPSRKPDSRGGGHRTPKGSLYSSGSSGRRVAAPQRSALDKRKARNHDPDNRHRAARRTKRRIDVRTAASLGIKRTGWDSFAMT